MGALRRATLLTGLALLVSGASAGADQSREGPKDAPSPSSTPTAVPAPARDGFAGVWVYNADESLNSANGRKEDNAAMRRAGNAGNNTSRGGGSNSGGGAGAGSAGGNTSAGSNPASAGGGGFGGGGGYGGGGFGSPFTSLVINERRDLVRDLLEVPVELKISLTDSDVTFIDHLRRELTYPTTGKKKKYQLSASVFEAKAYWDGSMLKKEIEGTEGFKMSETYMLSESGKRLFVMVRVYPPDKDSPPAGVNRVYDRVEK